MPRRSLILVAQKERNTYDHLFQRNQGLDQINECINACKIIFQQNDTKIKTHD